MSDKVQFEEGQEITYQQMSAPRKSFFVRLAIKLGAKTDRQASATLLIVAILFFIITLLVIMNILGKNPFIDDGQIIESDDYSPEFIEAMSQ